MWDEENGGSRRWEGQGELAKLHPIPSVPIPSDSDEEDGGGRKGGR